MRPILLLAVLALAGGCAYGGPGATPTSQPPTIPPTTSPVPDATATPLPATATPTTFPETAQPTPSPEQTGDPPDGLLTAGGDAVVGWLGTYCWGDTCADALVTAPKKSLPRLDVTSTSEMLSFSVSGGVEFSEWYAAYASTSNGVVIELGKGGDEYDPDSSASQPPLFAEISFAAPPPGDWVVHVRVSFVGGDAGYAWHVTVP